MENSQYELATESFSYSWLLDEKPSLDSLTESLIAYSNRYNEEAQNFNFDITPVSESAFSIVHADEIFSDGHIMPLYLHKSNIEAFNPCSISSTPLTPFYPLSDRTNKADFLKKNRKLCSRILLKKFYNFLRPICKRLSSSRKNAKVDDFERSWEIHNSYQESPTRVGDVYSDVDWAGNGNYKQGKSCRNKSLQNVKSKRHSPQTSSMGSPTSQSIEVSLDMENTISEAILHCKRSCGILSTESELSEA